MTLLFFVISHKTYFYIPPAGGGILGQRKMGFLKQYNGGQYILKNIEKILGD